MKTNVYPYFKNLGKADKIKKMALLAIAIGCLSISAMADSYVASSAPGSPSGPLGASWNNPYVGASGFNTAFSNGGNIYVKAGFYILSGSNSDPVYTFAATTSYNIQGGFPTSATGTDLTGYDANANTTTLSNNKPTSRFFRTAANYSGTITIKGLALTGSNGAGNGFMFDSQDGASNTTFTFTDLDVHDNNNGTGDGAFYFTSLGSSASPTNTVTFYHCLFDKNQATNGGAIAYASNYYNPLVINGCVFSNNNITATGGGALVASIDYNISIKNSHFCSNQSAGGGGAMYLTSVSGITIDNTVFTKNSCTSVGASWGGAIYAITVNESVTNSKFYNNHSDGAGGGGGAIYHSISYSLPTYTASHYDNNVFVGNYVAQADAGTNHGGGAMYIYAIGPSANAAVLYTCDGSTFSGNYVQGTGAKGGALYSYFSKCSSMNGSVFYNNAIPAGTTTLGADFVNYDATGSFANIQNCKVQLSSASTPTYSDLSGGGANYTFGTGNTANNTTDPGASSVAASYNCPNYITILPVTGLSLTAQATNGIPQLTWATLSEEHTSYFAVQSSSDGSNFTTIGKVAAAGNSSVAQSYFFIDNGATGSVVYYRLQIVDVDGKITFSNTAAVRILGVATGFRIFPNPATNLLNIETGVPGTYLVELFANDGRKLQAAEVASASGLLTIGISRTSIPQGVYLVKTTNAKTGASSYGIVLVK